MIMVKNDVRERERFFRSEYKRLNINPYFIVLIGVIIGLVFSFAGLGLTFYATFVPLAFFFFTLGILMMFYSVYYLSRLP